MTPLRQARRAVRRGLALGLFVTAFLDVAVLAVPLYDMQLYDRVLLSHNMSTVAMLSVACGLGLLLYGILDYLRSAVLVAIAENVQGALYQPLLAAGVRASLSDQPAAGGEAMRDLHEMRIFLSSGALAVPLDALCAPLLLGVMFLLHPAYGWLGVIGVALLCILGILSDMLVRPAVVAAAKERTDAGNQLAAGLREADMTDGLGMMDAMARRWARRHGAALEEVRAAAGRSDTAGAVAKLARLGLQAGVMALGVVLILSNQASPGSLMGANLLLGKVLGPFDALISTWRRWIAVTAAWRRLSVLMASRADVAAQVPPVPAPAFDHAGLVLSGVGFEDKATGRALLRDVALRLAPGTAMALVGPNGAGKSTLLRLMVGLLPASCGTVRLDGEAIATIDKTRIGYLPQGVHLLDGSIRHNVARFADSPMEAIVAAAAAADVHDLVGRMRHGYDTVVGQTTLSLSGGQKQRVGLARAMFGVPRLLGLDEPDASLDSEGEVALLRAIQAARDAGAVIVIATHRPKLLAAMDLVATLHDGRIQSVAPAFPAAPRQLAHA